MKTAGTILLLLLIGYTQWGYDVQFLIGQWQLKKAAREAWIASLPDNAFLRVSLAEIDAHGKWEEAGKECWYRHHLYDIIRQRTEADSTWLFCMDDGKEERLIRQAGEATKAGLDHDHQRTRSGHSLLIPAGDQVSETCDWHILSLPAIAGAFLADRYEPLPSRYNEILGPPPKA